LSLTIEGKRLAGFGREVQAQGNNMIAQIRGEQPTGPIVLASGQGILLYLLGAAIKRFPKDRWPLRVVTMSSPAAIEAVRDAHADICVTVVENPPEGLSSILLRGIGQIAVIPQNHHLAHKTHLQPQDLRGENIIVAPAGSPHRSIHDF